MEETAAIAPKTGPLTGHTEVLAGPSAVDEIRTGGVLSPPSRISKPFSVGANSDADHVSASSAPCGRVHFANVGESLGKGPVAGEDFTAPLVGFDLEQGSDSCSVEANLEASRTTEQTQRKHGDWSGHLPVISVISSTST